MGTFNKKLKADGTYHVPGKGERWGLQTFSDEQVSEWANDTACRDKEKCASELSRRTEERAARAQKEAARQQEQDEQLAAKRLNLSSNPFDPRTEVSADARYIAGRVVSTLWIIFVLIPFVLGLLFELLK